MSKLMKNIALVFYFIAPYIYSASRLDLTLHSPESAGFEQAVAAEMEGVLSSADSSDVGSEFYFDPDSPWVVRRSQSSNGTAEYTVTYDPPQPSPRNRGYEGTFVVTLTDLDGVVTRNSYPASVRVEEGDTRARPLTVLFTVPISDVGKIKIEVEAAVTEITDSSAPGEDQDGRNDLGVKRVEGDLIIANVNLAHANPNPNNANSEVPIPFNLPILPDDFEGLNVTTEAEGLDGDEKIKLKTLDTSIAQFVVDGSYVDEIEYTVRDGAPNVVVVGHLSGNTVITAEYNGLVLGEIDVKVGGSVEVDLNSAVTYRGPDGGRGVEVAEEDDLMGGDGVDDGDIEGSDPRTGILEEILNQTSTTPLLRPNVNVLVKDANNVAKGGVQVSFSGDNGKLQYDYTPGEEGSDPYTETNGEGKATVQIGAIPGVNTTLYARGTDIERLTVHLGKNADRQVRGGEGIDYNSNDVLNKNPVNDFSKQKYSSNLNQNSAISIDVNLYNDHQYKVVKQNFVGGVYDSPNTHSVSGFSFKKYNSSGELETEYQPAVDPNLLLTDPDTVTGHVIPYAKENFFNEDGSPRFVNDDPTFEGFDADAFLLGVGASMFPGYDFIDIIKETIFKPLFKGESTNYIVVTFSFIGLAADAGYFTGPAGAVANVVAGVLKKVSAMIPQPLLRFLVNSKGKILDGVRWLGDVITKYDGNIIKSASNFLGQINRLMETPIRNLASGATEKFSNVSKGLSVIYEKTTKKFFGDDAAEAVVRSLDKGKDELVGKILTDFDDEFSEFTYKTLRKYADETAEYADDAVEGIALVRERFDDINEDLVDVIFDEYEDDVTEFAFVTITKYADETAEFSDEAIEGIALVRKNIGEGADGLIDDLFEAYDDEAVEYTFATLKTFNEELAGLSDEAIQGVAAARTAVGREQADLIDDFIQGSEINPGRAEDSFSNIKKLTDAEDIEGMNHYVKELRDNRNNPSVFGTIEESHVAVKIHENVIETIDELPLGEVQFVGGDALQILRDPPITAIPDLNGVKRTDLVTENFLIQVKTTQQAVPNYSYRRIIKPRPDETAEAAARRYCRELHESSVEAGRRAAFIANKPADDAVKRMLNDFDPPILWKEVGAAGN